MPQVAKLIGGPGTGKTRELLNRMDLAVERLGDPMLVGFVSFTRAARREASERAAERFNMTPAQLERGGWFRTLHSVCFHCLGVKKDELLADDKASRDWLQENLQEQVGRAGDDQDGDTLAIFEDRTEADRALSLWGTARNRLLPLRSVWEEADYCDGRTPGWEDCLRWAERYEQAKRLDHRADFTDMVARFAGFRFDPETGAHPTEPDGEPPELEAWFHDEMQDSSALLDAAFRRIVEQPVCKWVYLAADPFQAIYRWAGADHRLFADWTAHKQDIMPKSWRCPAPVLELAESVLRDCSDYWDRRIAPSGGKGAVERERLGPGLAAEVDPREEWLLLARTNRLAKKLARLLDDAGVPWRSTRGRGGWDAPARNEAILALMDLEAGYPIDGGQWRHVLGVLPSASGGRTLLERGTKSRFRVLEHHEARDLHPWVMLDALAEIGGTAELAELMRGGRWKALVERADRYAAAVGRWGREAVTGTRVRVGTVHSVKGQEADNVAVLTTITEPCRRQAESPEGLDEETRVKYVAVTRARRRLVLLDEPRPRYRWRME